MAQVRLGELTAALLRDATLVPRWVAHDDAAAAPEGIACLECGNHVPPPESACSYCAWTYAPEGTEDA